MLSGDFRLLVGLGNPGSKYTGTRHNIGFMTLQKLASREGTNFRRQNKLYGLLAEVGSGANTLKLLMPTTYMNESGRSIRATLDWFDLSIDQLLVLVDDIDLPLGRLRLRTKGSSGGHNGLKNTIQHLGTQSFCRLKIGIGRDKIFAPQDHRSSTINHVLGNFTSQESPIVSQVINEVLMGLDLMKQDGLNKATTRLNSYRPEII